MSNLQNERDSLKSDNTSLKRDLDSLKQELASLEKTLQERTATAQAASVADVDKLTQVEEDLASIQEKYAGYAAKEDAVLSEQGDAGLLETKLYLDDFLTYEPLEAKFPGLWRRIKKYDRAFEKEGRESAFQDVIDIIYDLSEVTGDSQRLSILDDELQRNTDSPLKQELLEELKILIQKS